MRVRSARCPSCGAPKVTPYQSAYVYCDFCGQLMDFDANTAKYNSQGKGAGPRYRELMDLMAPKLAAAREAKDREALAACHRALYDQYMNDMPQAYSPRIGDPAYRTAVLERAVHAVVVTELDAEYAAKQAEQQNAIHGLVWDLDFATKKQICRADTFWKMFDLQMEIAEIARRICPEESHPYPDPDETPVELQKIMTASVMAQSWVAFLDEATGDELLRRAGVTGEYQDVQHVDLHDLACGHCGVKRPIPAGAKVGVCESCGHKTPVGTKVFCTQCGAPIVVPVGGRTASCESCKNEVSLIEFR